jgi:hypothetical protein
LRDDVYTPYLRRLETASSTVAATLGSPATHKRGTGLRGVVSRLRKSAVDRVSILTGNAVAVARLSRD